MHCIEIPEAKIKRYIPSDLSECTPNEYIEISKFYSTPKSNLFINGVLDKAITQLTKDKKIVKIGRGLIT